MKGALSAARLMVGALHVAAFFAATAWGFGIGHEVAGAWLGMLMGLNAGVCAVLLLSGLQTGLQKGMRRWRSP